MVAHTTRGTALLAQHSHVMGSHPVGMKHAAQNTDDGCSKKNDFFLFYFCFCCSFIFNVETKQRSAEFCVPLILSFCERDRYNHEITCSGMQLTADSKLLKSLAKFRNKNNILKNIETKTVAHLKYKICLTHWVMRQIYRHSQTAGMCSGQRLSVSPHRAAASIREHFPVQLHKML